MAELRRELGTRDLTLLSIIAIVGARWIAPAAHAGSGSILLWVLAAPCFLIPLAIAVTALTVREPEAGGMYVWAREGLRSVARIPVLLGAIGWGRRSGFPGPRCFT